MVMYLQQPQRIGSSHGGGTTAQLLQQIRSISADIERLSGLGKGSSDSVPSDSFLRLLQATDFTFRPSLWRSLFHRDPAAIDKRRAAELLGGLPEQERNDGLKVVGLASQKRGLVSRLQDEARALAWLRIWLFLHVPIALGLLVALTVHIFLVFYY